MERETGLRARAARALQGLARLAYRLFSPHVCQRLSSLRIVHWFYGLDRADVESVYECEGGLRLRLTRGDAAFLGILQMGRSNPLETALIRAHLRPGDTMVAVGTYKDGWPALVGAQCVGDSGTVICFEPMPAFCERFRENVALNGFRHVRVEQLAVSEAVGEARFSVDGAGSSLALAAPGERIVVRTTTLDDYLRDHGITRVDLLSIDAEGAEPMILRGARATLTNTTCLLIEVIDRFMEAAGATRESLIAELAGYGFKPYAITRRGPIPWAPGVASETANMFFAKPRPAR